MTTEDYKLLMKIAVSIAALSVALYVIMSNKDAKDDKKWAYATVAGIVGYWLNSS